MFVPQDNVVYLVRQAKAGNNDAFASLVLLYENEICGYLTSLLQDGNEAQDCAQRAFFKAWRKISTLKNETSFRPWLYTIVRNEARDYLRKRRKTSFLSLEDLEKGRDIESAFQLEIQVTQTDLINLALSTLSPKLRACLRLDAWGFSHHEIAQILGMRTSSVGTYICMARRQFRQVYSRLEHE